MKISLWVAFLMIILVAFFAIQNSGAPPVSIKFFLWKFETSLIYTILGSVGLGILLTLLFWIPREIRSSFRKSKSSQTTSPVHSPESV
jgi:putative membrane protein